MRTSLLRLVGQRLLMGVLLLLAVSVLIFVGTQVLPGDVASSILGQQATEQNLANLRAELGLDRPAVERYFDWLGGFATGDLGRSLANKQPVIKLIGTRLENTLFLAAATAAIAVPLALLLGVISARYRDRWPDRAINIFSLSAISFPEFFVGYLLMLVFALELAWVSPLSTVRPGMDLFQRMEAIALPIATLTFAVLAHMQRQTRAAVLNVMGSAYIETAELKGIRPINIIVRHAMPNAVAPIINVVMLNLAYLVVGVVVVEVIFVYPGLGTLMVDAVGFRDVPVVQTTGLIFAATFILLNIVADVVGLVANPRLRHPK
jgi:peptide/nickel transport system permease protein